ncbi:hypothetical protein KNE206_57760 [Kitasatospora sp. NE20-6]|uniref:alpha/beta fold hydrolase n=1 Tax=Kitasatospora sp. NE20-6 TaxID=2859066 RepID=UPI0034DC7D33
MSGIEEFDAWDVHEYGPADAPHRVLLLPGALCSTAVFDDMAADPALAGAPVRMVAVTVPGFAGTTPPQDLSMENYAALLGRFGAERGCTTVVGHSLGANIALEMAAAGHAPGPVVLLSPSISRPDEVRDLAIIDRLGRIPGLGGVTWSAALRLTPRMMEDDLPEGRREAFIADLRKNDPAFCRRIVHHYFEHLDRYGSLAPRLRASGATAWVVRGDRDEIGLTEEERAELAAGPQITLVTVPDAGHMLMIDQPAALARLVAGVVLGA